MKPKIPKETKILLAVRREREECAKLIDKIGYSHTAGLNQHIASEFARAADAIRARNEGTANGIEFSEKLTPEGKRKSDAQATFKVFATIGSPEYEYMDMHARGIHASRAFVHEGVPVVVTELYISSPTLARFTLELVK